MSSEDGFSPTSIVYSRFGFIRSYHNRLNFSHISGLAVKNFISVLDKFRVFKAHHGADLNSQGTSHMHF